MPPQRGGKPRNRTVTDAFQSIILPNRIIPAVKCLYCHLQMASGTSRQQAHLNQCTAYINRPINEPAALVQTMLSPAVKPLSIPVVKTLNRTAAMTVYMSNLPLNHYENPYVRAHEHAFHSQYTPSSHTAMAGVLLDEASQTVKAKVDPMLMGHHLLQRWSCAHGTANLVDTINIYPPCCYPCV